MKKITIILWAAILWVAPVFAQDLPEHSSLEDRVEKLEGSYDHLAKDLDLQFRELKSGMNWKLILGAVPLLGLLIGGYYRINSQVEGKVSQSMSEHLVQKINETLPDKMNKEVPRAVEAYFTDHREKVFEMIYEAETEDKFKASSKILVLCETESRCEEMEKVLVTLFKFEEKNVDAKLFDEQVAPVGYDLVIIDREGYRLDDGLTRLTDSNLTHYLNKFPNYFPYLYFGTYQPKLNPFAKYVNFANTRFTLYYRLLESFRFVEKIGKDEVDLIRG